MNENVLEETWQAKLLRAQAYSWHNRFLQINNQKVKLIVKNLCKKNRCKFRLKFIANGESFLTKLLGEMIF